MSPETLQLRIEGVRKGTATAEEEIPSHENASSDWLLASTFRI